MQEEANAPPVAANKEVFISTNLKEVVPLCSAADDGDHELRCSICWELYDDGEHKAVEITGVHGCRGHIFGRSCLLKWLDMRPPKTNDKYKTCPNCRSNLYKIRPFHVGLFSPFSSNGDVQSAIRDRARMNALYRAMYESDAEDDRGLDHDEDEEDAVAGFGNRAAEWAARRRRRDLSSLATEPDPVSNPREPLSTMSHSSFSIIDNMHRPSYNRNWKTFGGRIISLHPHGTT